MSEVVYQEEKDFGTYEQQYLTADIKVTQTDQYLIFDMTSRCGRWINERFGHEERWTLPPELEVVKSAMIPSETVRECVRKADEWFAKVEQARQELIQPQSQPLQAYIGKNDIF